MIAPENTIHAFEKAGMLKYWGIETDIQQTSDGVWVIYHDTTLDTMSDGTGAIKYKTLAEIKALNITVGVNLAYYPNSKIPTLEEYLVTVSYTHLRAHETRHDLVCRLLLEKKKK